MKKRWTRRVLPILLLLGLLLPGRDIRAAEPTVWDGGTEAARETVTAAEALPEIVDPYRLYTYDDMVRDISALEARYPDLISAGVLGYSVEGREIPMFTLGKGKREIILCGALHAREYITVNFLMYMAEHYCLGYVSYGDYQGYSYRLLLDNVRFVIVPMANPDGVTLAQMGADYPYLPDLPPAAENAGGYHAWKANIRGVDLNANWPYRWNNRNGREPGFQNYPGTEPLSEPETRAMATLLESSPFYALCSFHTSGESIYWIDNSNPREMYDRFRPTVDRLARITGYKSLGYENVTAFGGYMVNYARATYDRMCMAMEISPFYSRYPFSDYKGFQKTVEKVYPAALVIADAVINMAPLDIPETSAAYDTVDVVVNGRRLVFADQRPVVRNGNTLCPIRAVCEACGLSLVWNSDTQSADISDGSKQVHIQIDNPYLWNGAVHLPMPAAPQVLNGRTVLPLRAVLEEFGITVGWDGAASTVVITTA